MAPHCEYLSQNPYLYLRPVLQEFPIARDRPHVHGRQLLLVNMCRQFANERPKLGSLLRLLILEQSFDDVYLNGADEQSYERVQVSLAREKAGPHCEILNFCVDTIYDIFHR